MTPSANSVRHRAFAVTAPGLAPLAADELRALSIVPTEVEPAGVAFEATDEKLWLANLWLRTASRIVVRVADFQATAFHELERFARQIRWEEFVDARRPVQLRVTCRKSRLYHSDAVADRIASAISRRMGSDTAWRSVAGEDDADGTPRNDDGAQLFTVRFLHDRCTISADSSGELLHRRGYREAIGKAPLRETLAAATILASRWDRESPLVDPLCGSGTIPIEAALLARRIPPGRQRDFAFMRWPDFDGMGWAAVLARADAGVLPSAPAPILAFDRDAGAIAATTENAERAGVLADLQIDRRTLSELTLPPEYAGGWIVANPPYGKRVGEGDVLGPLYSALGDVLRERAPGWTAALLSADPTLERRVGLRWHEALRTSNGGIAVRVIAAEVPRS